MRTSAKRQILHLSFCEAPAQTGEPVGVDDRQDRWIASTSEKGRKKAAGRPTGLRPTPAVEPGIDIVIDGSNKDSIYLLFITKTYMHDMMNI